MAASGPLYCVSFHLKDWDIAQLRDDVNGAAVKRV